MDQYSLREMWKRRTHPYFTSCEKLCRSFFSRGRRKSYSPSKVFRDITTCVEDLLQMVFPSHFTTVTLHHSQLSGAFVEGRATWVINNERAGLFCTMTLAEYLTISCSYTWWQRMKFRLMDILFVPREYEMVRKYILTCYSYVDDVVGTITLDECTQESRISDTTIVGIVDRKCKECDKNERDQRDLIFTNRAARG